MDLYKALKFLIQHARYSRSQTGVSETTLENACELVESFLENVVDKNQKDV